MEEMTVEHGSGIIDSLIPNAQEDPLAGPLYRLRKLSSTYPLLGRLDFAELVCTEQWNKPVETLSKGKITRDHSFFAPLCSLRSEISQLWSRWKGSTSERADLLVVMGGYNQFIEDVCAAKKEERIQLLVGPARLYGRNRVWQLSQTEGRRLAGVDFCNQSLAGTKPGTWETRVGKKSNVLFKLLTGPNPPQADREFAVTISAHLLFGDCVLEKEVIKLSSVWVADVGGQVGKGTPERQRLVPLRTQTGKFAVKVFGDKSKLKKKPKLLGGRVASVVMACEVSSITSLAKRFNNWTSVGGLNGKSVSTQFCLSLLVRPSRDKLENLLACNDDKVMAMEYAESLLPPVLMRKGELILSLRSMLLMLYRNQLLDNTVRKQLAEVNPEETILHWLHQIAQRNSKCEQSGFFSKSESEKLGFPIMVSHETVSLTYRALRCLNKMCRSEGQITLGQLFKAVHPEVATLYERFAEKSSNRKDQERLLFPEKGFCLPSETLSKSDPVYQGLLRVAVQEPNQQDKKTPFEVAEQWFREVPLEEYSDEECVAFITKALTLSPEWHNLRLRHSPLRHTDLAGILKEFPQIKSLSLEGFSETLTKDGLVGLGSAYLGVEIAIGECSHISASDLQALAKAKGKFSILLGENTYRLGVADLSEMVSAALELGVTTVAEYCVREGVNLRQSDKTDATLLHRAAKEWPLESLEFLLNRLKDIDPRDGQKATPFLLACARGDVAVIELLKKRGASLSTIGAVGLTGFHHAVISGRQEAVKLLLDWGVGLENLSDKGFNALHLAVEAKQKDMVSIIAGCQHQHVLKLLNQGDREKGATPLHLALRGTKRTEIVQLLVGTGCNVDICDKSGSAPLHWAAEHEHVKSFKILLEAGANLRATDAKDRTAVDVAIDKGHITVLEAVIRSEKLGENHSVVNDLVTLLVERRDAKKAEAGELFVLGLCYELGRGGLDLNMGTAQKCFKEADTNGSSSAQYHLAKIVEKQGMFKTAFNLYTRAAKQGDVGAQYCLGLYFWKGTGCDHKNEQKAIKWFQSAAKGGHSEASFQMYNICIEGRGVKKDPWRAREYLQAAADAGHIEAIKILEL